MTTPVWLSDQFSSIRAGVSSPNDELGEAGFERVEPFGFERVEPFSMLIYILTFLIKNISILYVLNKIFSIVYKMSGFTSDSFPSVLGGGIPGGQPKLLGGGSGGGRSSTSGMEGGGQRELNRVYARRVFNFKVYPNGNPANITPFRRYLNAGDTAGTTNSAPSPLLGSPNQLSGNSMVSRIHAHQGGTTTGEALYSGNTKFVYDGSDYVRFKKLVANNKTYNDLSFGGASASTVAQALRRVRN